MAVQWGLFSRAHARQRDDRARRSHEEGRNWNGRVFAPFPTPTHRQLLVCSNLEIFAAELLGRIGRGGYARTGKNCAEGLSARCGRVTTRRQMGRFGRNRFSLIVGVAQGASADLALP
jgi:hypothetical protein